MDVICARGAAAYAHAGNKRFRDIISQNTQKYASSRTKTEKSIIVSVIVNSIRESSPEGGFIKNESGTWYEVGDHAAREKVGQCLRDALHTIYRSSSKAKELSRRSKRKNSKDSRQNQDTATKINKGADNDRLDRLDFLEMSSNSINLGQRQFSSINLEKQFTEVNLQSKSFVQNNDNTTKNIRNQIVTSIGTPSVSEEHYCKLREECTDKGFSHCYSGGPDDSSYEPVQVPSCYLPVRYSIEPTHHSSTQTIGISLSQPEHCTAVEHQNAAASRLPKSYFNDISEAATSRYAPMRESAENNLVKDETDYNLPMTAFCSDKERPSWKMFCSDIERPSWKQMVAEDMSSFHWEDEK